jgi:putative inorganic carbon (hco3(-)) transporter
VAEPAKRLTKTTMLAAFKLYIMPYLVYLGMFWCVWQGLTKRAIVPVYMFLVLLIFPQFWYPTHSLPLGSMTLTILTVAALIGGMRQRAPDDPRPPHKAFVFVLIISSYIALWMTSMRYGLPAPISTSNDLFAHWRNYVTMLLLYFVGFNMVKSEDDVRRIIKVFCWVLIVMAQRELAGFASGDSFSYNRRSVGSFYIVGLNANHFAAFIAHISVVAIGLLAMDDDKNRKRLYLACFVASLYPLFFSYSRGAYVAVLFAMIIVGVVRYRSLLPLIGIFLIFWDSILPASVVDRIQMTESPDGQIEESAALRLVVWDLAKKLFSENPIFGIGFQGFYYASANLPLHNVHNYYLQTACEQGVVGVLILGTFFLKAYGSGWRLYRDGMSPLIRGVGLGFVACISAMAITNIFGDRFSQLTVGGYFWLLFGVVDRAWAMSTAKAKAPGPSGHVTAASPQGTGHKVKPRLASDGGAPI